MTKIRLELDQASRRLLADLASEKTTRQIYGIAKKATVSAVRKMRTSATREIRKEKNIKLRDIKGRIRILPLSGTTADDLSGGIVVSGKTIPVSKFRTRVTETGVRAYLKKGRQANYPGAFLARMKTGHVGVFWRAYPERRPRKKYMNHSGMKQHTHLPIKQIYTPGLASVFGDSGKRNRVVHAGVDEYKRTMFRLLKRKILDD